MAGRLATRRPAYRHMEQVDALKQAAHSTAQLRREQPVIRGKMLLQISRRVLYIVGRAEPRTHGNNLIMATDLQMRQPLDSGQLRDVDAWWRAANYLSVGQIYQIGRAHV